MRTANLGRRRWSSGGLGAVLLAAGLIAASWLVQVAAEVMPPPVALDAEAVQSGGITHEMIDAMHGEGTADHVREMEGVDETMAQCATMMKSMGRHDG